MKPGTSRDVVVYFFMSFARLGKGNGFTLWFVVGFQGLFEGR
jgi:hypothetical protein